MQTWNTEFIIIVTERFHWLIEPLQYMYERYFPVPLTFFSDRLIEGGNAIEVFPRDMQIYREPCGRLVKDALRGIDKPLVFFGYMDLLPIHLVDLQLLKFLETYMKRHSGIARGNLWSQADNSVKNALEWDPRGKGGFGILDLPKDDPHIGQIGCASLLPALWRKDFLLEFIEDGWTFDQVESTGQHKFAAQDKWHSVAMLPGLFDSCHLCYTSDATIARTSTIPDAEDRAFVERFVPAGMRIE